MLRNRQFKHTWWYKNLMANKPKEEKTLLAIRCSKSTSQTFKILFQIEKNKDPDLTEEEFLKKLLSTYYRRF